MVLANTAFLKSVAGVDSKETILCINDFIFHYGKPIRIITDRGTAFTANIFETFCKDHNIQHIKIATATSRANGQAERLNRTIVASFSSISIGLDCLNWDMKIGEVQWAINNSVHSVTRQAPASLVFRFECIGLGDNPLTAEILSLNEERRDPIDYRYIEQKLEQNRVKVKSNYDKKRRKSQQLQPGQHVLIRIEASSSAVSHKLRPRFKGPYKVKKVLPNDRYVVGVIEGEMQTSREFEGVFPIDSLKLVSYNEG